MIMSPFVLDRNVPLIGPPRGGQIEADGDEQGGVGKSGSAGRCAQQTAAGSGCEQADAGELPAGEAAVEAVSGGRGRRSEAPQCGARIASCLPAEVSAEGAGAGAGEVRRAGGRALWSNASGGALSVRGWAEDRCGNAATLDAGGGAGEARAEAGGSPSSAAAQGALWGAGADGRELPPLAGGARWRGVLDGHGR